MPESCAATCRLPDGASRSSCAGNVGEDLIRLPADTSPVFPPLARNRAGALSQTSKQLRRRQWMNPTAVAAEGRNEPGQGKRDELDGHRVPGKPGLADHNIAQFRLGISLNRLGFIGDRWCESSTQSMYGDLGSAAVAAVLVEIMIALPSGP